jgi:peptidoglycan/LPS O-acetylase OafA/YrhL
MAERLFYPRLEALRGLAAASVLIFHILQSQAGLNPSLADQLGWGNAIFCFISQTIFHGGAAVILFFVLSGFVMGVNVDVTRPPSPRMYARFLVRRFFRLYPVIVISVVVALLVAYAARKTTYDFSDIARFLILRDVSFNGPLWSVRIEIVVSCFYLIALFAVRNVSDGIKILMLIYLIVAYWLGLRYSGYSIAFLLGLLIPSLGKATIETLGPRLATLLLPVVFVGLYASAPIAVDLLRLVNGPLLILMQSFGAFYLVAYTMYGLPAWSTPLDHPVAHYFGRISYCLYALHYPIVVAIGDWVGNHLDGIPLIARTFAVFVAAAPITIALAHACMHFVERPFIDLGRRLAGQSEPR